MISSVKQMAEEIRRDAKSSSNERRDLWTCGFQIFPVDSCIFSLVCYVFMLKR
ncbi:hypothetical protein NMG60_11007552 [Bertholletia excelsa]